MEPEPSKHRISQRDLAKQLGVSHVTISLALRDDPRISKKLRLEIRQHAEKVGYIPDPMLAALSSYRRDKTATPIHSVIAWINAWPEPEKLRAYKEFDLYWQGASAAAAKFGYRLDEFRMDADFNPARLHQILSSRGIRGLLLPPQKQQPDWEDFPWSDYFVVRFGRSLQSPNCHVVTADHVANTMLAFNEIQKRGYRRIGLIVEESRIRESGHLFEGGYKLAQLEVPEEDRVPVLPFSAFPNGQRGEAIVQWIRKHQVDAVFTDVAEVPALMTEAGIRIPHDVGLAATSILDANADAGIDQHPEEIGRVGFLMLNSLINDGSKGIPPIFRQILIAGSWHDGNSLPLRQPG